MKNKNIYPWVVVALLWVVALLNYMDRQMLSTMQEAMKIDFDVAIIGCGAYGFPLAAKLKLAGKQAIHLAGATQLLFGIKGKRWEENGAFAYVQKFFNDAWVYPSDEDKPKEAAKVENGCYW